MIKLFSQKLEKEFCCIEEYNSWNVFIMTEIRINEFIVISYLNNSWILEQFEWHDTDVNFLEENLHIYHIVHLKSFKY